MPEDRAGSSVEAGKDEKLDGVEATGRSRWCEVLRSENALDAAGRDEESRIQLDAAMAMFDEMGIRPDAVPV